MKLAILDRDGVINQDSSQYIKSASEWRPIDGSINAIARLSKAGFRVFLATNQSGLGRGLFDDSDLTAMHKKMCDLVKQEGGQIERIFFCPHAPSAGCNCRKPATGMLDQLEAYLGHGITDAILIGDSIKDLQLAIAKNCQPILVLTGNGAKTQQKLLDDKLTVNKQPGTDSYTWADIVIYPDLATAVNCLLSNEIDIESSAI